MKSDHSNLAAIAALVSLSPSEAIVVPAVADRFTESAGIPRADLVAMLFRNGELRRYFAKVCRDVAASDAAKEVAREALKR